MLITLAYKLIFVELITNDSRHFTNFTSLLFLDVGGYLDTAIVQTKLDIRKLR